MGFILRNTAIPSEINEPEPNEPHLLRVTLPDYPHEFEYPEGALFYFTKSQEWLQLIRVARKHGWRPKRDYYDFYKNSGYDFTFMAIDDALRLAGAIELALPTISLDMTDRAKRYRVRTKRWERRLLDTSADAGLTHDRQRVRLWSFVEFLRLGCTHQERLDSDIWLYDWADHENRLAEDAQET